MGRITAFAATLLALAAIAGCGGSNGEGSGDFPTRTVPIELDPPGTPQTMQPLTKRQRRQTRTIIADDPRFERIASVDLKRQRLAGLAPDQADEIDWPEGFETFRFPSGR